MLLFFKVMLVVACFLNSRVALSNTDSLFFKKIQELEKSFSLPPNLLAAIVKVESDFRAEAVSKTIPVSYGLAQITQDAAKHRCGLFHKNEKLLLSPSVNLNCAATILQEDLQTYEKKLPLVIAAYNAGTACICNGQKYLNAHDGKLCNVRKGAPILCERRGAILNRGYVKKVEEARKKFGLVE
jgi:soluble lytic murein transglycosylase-like protein